MPRNCLILGCGRSGTSLTAGLLAKAGYFMGEELDHAGLKPANPKGQFEDPEINGINEDLLGPPIYDFRHRLFNKLLRPRQRSYVKVQYYQRWLVALPLSVQIPADPKLVLRIAALTSHEPYCFKDPRFSYTLGIWRPYVKNAVFICVFRHPAITAASIVNACKIAPHLRDLPMDTSRAMRIWSDMYNHILQIHYPAGGEWIFAHYDQLMDGGKLSEIEKALAVPVDPSFPDPNLRRSKPVGSVSREAMSIYHRLCDLAGYKP
ncbi:MAG: sulfotransferase [Candidatus Binataceae bacterium]|nr:sulfotransferase [Candidatus Binataceae bacterium]